MITDTSKLSEKEKNQVLQWWVRRKQYFGKLEMFIKKNSGGISNDCIFRH